MLFQKGGLFFELLKIKGNHFDLFLLLQLWHEQMFNLWQTVFNASKFEGSFALPPWSQKFQVFSVWFEICAKNKSKKTYDVIPFWASGTNYFLRFSCYILLHMYSAVATKEYPEYVGHFLLEFFIRR